MTSSDLDRRLFGRLLRRPAGSVRNATASLALAVGFAFVAGPAGAHGGRAGEVEIEHPYAVPSPPGAVNGAAYLQALTNGGKTPDRLLRVASPVAQRVELHSMAVDASGVMRMREVGELALPPGERVTMKPGMGYHIMLIGLKQPLKAGDRFPMTLEFERNGKAEVEIVVQPPKAAAGHDAHAH